VAGGGGAGAGSAGLGGAALGLGGSGGAACNVGSTTVAGLISCTTIGGFSGGSGVFCEMLDANRASNTACIASVAAIAAPRCADIMLASD
jgi:hypothetical protein